MKSRFKKRKVIDQENQEEQEEILKELNLIPQKLINMKFLEFNQMIDYPKKKLPKEQKMLQIKEQEVTQITKKTRIEFH